MKIRNTPCCIDGTANRLMAICGAVILGATVTATLSQAQTASAVQNGLFKHGSDSFRVVSTADYRTAADAGRPQAGTVRQVGSVDPLEIMPTELASCTTCDPAAGSFSSASPCGSCGNSCGNSCGGACSGDYFAGDSYGGGYQGCGIPCDPYCYVTIEGLYIEPEDVVITPSDNFRLDNFDYESGARITIGCVGDCVHGYEVTLVGSTGWESSRSLNNTAPRDTFLSPLSSFTDVVDQTHTHDADFWSLEGNRTLVGWEVAKLLIGGRYISYDENYSYFTRTNTNENGLLSSRTDNALVGLQIGIDLLYPICEYGYTDFRARAGGYLNFADLDFGIVNAGVGSFGSDSDTGLAGMFELGSGVRYQLGEILSVRAGVELWYLAEVAQAPTEALRVVAGSRKIGAGDGILFTGISVGAELRY